MHRFISVRCGTAAVVATLCASVFAQSPEPAPAASGAAPAADAVIAPVDIATLIKSNVSLKGKRFYIAEYRVLFEVEGKVTASTRAAYFGGRDYGATRVTVNYQLPKPDIGLLQAITDKAYADFLARLEAQGLKPEPADAFTRDNGAIYEAGAEGSKPGAEVTEEVELGYGKRKYLVMTPTGTKQLARGFIGLGAGSIGKRIDWSHGGLEGISVGIAVNLAAQESSGGGSSMFKRGSSANASAAMEVVAPPKQLGVLQTHAHTQVVSLSAPLPVPGEFATLKESGGYDSAKDPVVAGINMLGRLTMGLAGNNSKRVEMVLEADPAALEQLSLQALTSVNKGMAAALR